jgi:type IV pilus assembly protein PilC
MPVFTYKAIDVQGKAIRGRMEAANPVDLELRLRRIGLDFVDGKTARSPRPMLGSARLKRQDMITFCFHLEQLIKAGVPLLEGLTDLRDSMEQPRFRAVVASLVEGIEGGKRLSQAMSEQPAVFDRVFWNLIRAGEETGRLPEVLNNLTEALKWQDEIASHARKMVIYPSFVGTIIVVVTLFLMVVLVPQMTGFIKNMGQEIPLQTRMLLATSAFMQSYWWAVLMFPVVATMGIGAALRSSPALRYRFDQLKLELPVVGSILRKLIMARFAGVFAMLYQAGITILDSVRVCEDIVGNRVIREGMHRAGQQIAEGQTVSAAFAAVGLFPPLVIRMLRVGETTGALDSALQNVSYFYSREAREGIERLQVMIEPALTLLMGTILGWVMLSVLGPVYDTISRIKI